MSQALKDLVDNDPPPVRVELRKWRFNKEHQLTGSIYFHPAFDDGAYYTIIRAYQCIETREYFKLKSTASEYVFYLFKQQEATGFDTIKELREHFKRTPRKRV